MDERWKTVLKNKKILVADDDEINRELMHDILEPTGCYFEFAVNGNEAVEKYLSGNFDLILMDLRMPEKDGIQATKEIREIEKAKGAHIPIIALTASVLEEDRNALFSVGIDEFILKPIHLQDLREKIYKFIKGDSLEKPSS